MVGPLPDHWALTTLSQEPSHLPVDRYWVECLMKYGGGIFGEDAITAQNYFSLLQKMLCVDPDKRPTSSSLCLEQHWPNK